MTDPPKAKKVVMIFTDLELSAVAIVIDWFLKTYPEIEEKAKKELSSALEKIDQKTMEW